MGLAGRLAISKRPCGAVGFGNKGPRLEEVEETECSWVSLGAAAQDCFRLGVDIPGT